MQKGAPDISGELYLSFLSPHSTYIVIASSTVTSRHATSSWRALASSSLGTLASHASLAPHKTWLLPSLAPLTTWWGHFPPSFHSYLLYVFLYPILIFPYYYFSLYNHLLKYVFIGALSCFLSTLPVMFNKHMKINMKNNHLIAHSKQYPNSFLVGSNGYSS